MKEWARWEVEDMIDIREKIREGRTIDQAWGGDGGESVWEHIKNFIKTPNLGSARDGSISRIYKLTDRLMEPSGNLIPGDEIYIDCKPTNTLGEVIEEGENIIEAKKNTTNEVFDELSEMVTGGNQVLEIGFQVIIGLILLGVCYYIGKKVFIKIPNKIIEEY